MKMFFFLLTLSASAFAQYEFPRPDRLCSPAQINATKALVKGACDAKLAEFSAEHGTSCETWKVTLDGCRATCHQGSDTYAKLTMTARSNCRNQQVSLRKTVITYL